MTTTIAFTTFSEAIENCVKEIFTKAFLSKEIAYLNVTVNVFSKLSCPLPSLENKEL